jgi:hypothetical protein
MELGLSPLNSLRCICVIKGTPTIWGTVKNALAIKSGNLIKIESEYFGKEMTDEWTCKVTVFRRNPEMSFMAEFSYSDAKRANLITKDNWRLYPKKMLYNRAKNTAISEAFAELFYNIYSSEEIEDLPMKEITVNSSENNSVIINNPPQLTKQQIALEKSGWAKPPAIEQAYKISEENKNDEEVINNLFNN